MREKPSNYQDHLQFLKNLDEVNKAIQGTPDLQQMMSNVLDTVLSILDCDRAFLLYPCDPDASSFHIPTERAKAEYPGVDDASFELPVTAEAAKTFRLVLDTHGPVDFGPESAHAADPDIAEQFNIKSYLAMAIYPKVGKPWIFGLHQCSHARIWTSSEKELVGVIGHRIADGLSVLLSYQELLENRTFLDNIFENIPNMVFVKDAQDLRYIRLNKAGEQLLGYSQQELRGKSAYDFFPKEEVDFITAKDREVLDRKELVDIPEETIHTKYGDKLLHTKKIPLFDKTGKPAYLLGISEDITERKQMEQALITREREFRTLAENSPDNIARHDTHCRTVYVNPSQAKTIGLPASEMLGITPKETEIGGIDEPREYHAKIEEVLRTGKEAEMDLLLPDSGAGVRYHNIRFVAERGADGAITGVLSIGRDITERKRADEEVQRLRNYLSNIIDSMPSVLVGVDGDGKVIQWNRQAEQVTGVSFKNARSQPLVDVFPSLMDEMDRIKTAIQDRRVLTDLKVPRKHQDETRYEDVTIFPLMANGAEGAVIRVDDVTERVRLEEMMIQNEKMLSVGGLAAGMAHEINNPLAGILQSASVLVNRLTGDLPANHKAAEAAGTSMAVIRQYLERRKLHEMLENIHTSGSRAAAIVKNMLSFARISENSQSSHDLGSLLDQTLDLLKTDYDMKKHHDFKQIDIVREYDEKVGPVPCHGNKIQQVFMNILKNGAEAMAEVMDAQALPTFILRITDDGDWVRVEIEDNGPGMDAKTIRRIFEPFFTTKPIGKGTGLGLSVSYFIVNEGHGGEMDVHAPEAGGTCFVIRLPKTGFQTAH